MLKSFSLRTFCFCFVVQVALFDTLKAPLLSKVQVDELASKFSDLAKTSSGWRYNLLTANEVEALIDFSVTVYHLANDYLTVRGTSSWRSLVCG
ncbi:hypothetical protein [Grimontia marina]|uniref:Putative NAD(+)--arginine ADP-ribosyltransferase Vis n=1 Tax=Grimontia marina TaxID=646534 RepID=A0A128FJ23_9GAMM|nr:hypothetical protein [Grimontia marina]CZF86792.1 Putative NAD(+)--arginine ADP-ribosyltransferase Vis precursor [Grimontia marina]